MPETQVSYTTIPRVIRPTRPLLIAFCLFAATRALAQVPGVTGRVEKIDPVQHLVALDLRWQTAFDAVAGVGVGYDERAAYVPLKTKLVAVGLDRGETRWEVPLTLAHPAATGDGLVFVATEKQLLALDERTGATTWTLDLPAPLASPPYWDTGWVVLSLAGGELVAVKADDGRIVWRQALGAVLAAPPSPAGDTLFVVLEDRRLVAVNLASGTQVWTQKFSSPLAGVLALDEQIAVSERGNPGRLYSVDPDDGKIDWNFRAGGGVVGTPAADEDHIYFAALDNVLRALDRDSGNLKWLRALPSRPRGGPIRTGDVVIVPHVAPEVTAYSARTGAPAFTFATAGLFSGPPFLRDSARPTAPRFISMTREGVLQGFGPRYEQVPQPITTLPGVRVGG